MTEVVARARASLLQRLIAERNWTREDTLERLEERARRMDVRQFALSLRQLDRWLAGEIHGRPRPGTCRVVEAEFGHPIADLLSAPEEPMPLMTPVPATVDGHDVRGMVVAAAHESSRLGIWVDGAAISEFTIASFRSRLSYLAAEYVHAPLPPVFQQLTVLRDEVFEHLRKKPEPGTIRELYFLGGATCGMLAFASGDLGHPGAAMLQAQTALACAEKADHTALRAWILGNQAVTLDWYGRSDAGVELARRAYAQVERARVPGTVLARLASIEARALARLGNVDEARRALASATDARDRTSGTCAGDRDDLDELGGIMTFPHAQQHFYAGSTFLRIEDAVEAENAASAAISAYETGRTESRSYGDEALARIDVAAARLRQRQPDIDGAVAALQPVLVLDDDMRLPALAGPLSEVADSLGKASWQRSPSARYLRLAIAEFNRAISPHTRNVEITT